MRIHAAVLVMVVLGAARADDPKPAKKPDDAPKAITPAEAAKKLDEKCTVEMEVKSVGMPKSGRVVFLNYETDFRSTQKLTIMLGQQALEKMKKKKVEDVSAYYKGKTIRVTGLVKLYSGRPEIVVNDPDDI